MRHPLTEQRYKSRKNVLHKSPTYWPHLGPHLSWDNSFFTSYSRVMGVSRCSAKIILNVSWARPRMKSAWCSFKPLPFWSRSDCYVAYLKGAVWSPEATSFFFSFFFFAEVLGICWERVNSIQQLTDWMILVGQPSTRPQDEQHKVSDPEVLKSSWRMRRASPPQLSSPQADHAQGLTEPLLGAHLWLGEEMWPGPSPAGQHWIWQGKKDG